MEGPISRGSKVIANYVLSNAINSDGEGYNNAQLSLYCQEGSTPMEGSISRGTKVRNKRCIVQRVQLRWRDPSRGVQKCAKNVVLPRRINCDGGIHLKGSESAQRTLCFQTRSILMVRGTNVRNKLCLVKRNQH